MIQFCFKSLYKCRMEMDCNLKTGHNFFKFIALACALENSLNIFLT